VANLPLMYESKHERRAVERWHPGQRWYHPALAALVIGTSRFIMKRMNRLEIEGLDRFDALMDRGGRGLLTFSNHISLFDDPILLSNFGLPGYPNLRWVAADAINFFGSAPKAWLFTAGRGVPIVRGAGLDQPGFHFLRERLREGAWVHFFPEGGRTRDPRYLLRPRLRNGMGHLMADTRPIALPFYHYGMHAILPIGAKTPRRGNTVRLLFGEPFDCAGADDADALTARSYEALRGLERRLHPDAQGEPS
jgi:monolysocardiolipin acyltransferase